MVRSVQLTRQALTKYSGRLQPVTKVYSISFFVQLGCRSHPEGVLSQKSQPKSYYVHNLSRLKHGEERSAHLRGVDLENEKPVVSTLLAALTLQLMPKQDMKLDTDDSQSTLR